MSSKIIAQLCQLGGAVQRGIVTKELVAKYLTVGHAAASGDNEAIEVQAAYESAGDAPLPVEVAGEIDKHVEDILARATPPAPPPSGNPLKA